MVVVDGTYSLGIKERLLKARLTYFFKLQVAQVRTDQLRSNCIASERKMTGTHSHSIHAGEGDRRLLWAAVAGVVWCAAR